MCNIVTEFYLYSIVYIYLINSRLDVTLSVRHHFRIKLYQGPVSLKERLLYTLNKLFVKQVKSLLLDLDPFILLSSPHNIKYIKFTSP